MDPIVVALLIGAAGLVQEDRPPLPLGGAFEVVVGVDDRGIESTNPNVAFTFEPERDGTLYCWGECDGWGLVIQVEVAGDRETKRLAWYGEGRAWPAVVYDVHRGTKYLVIVGSTASDRAGMARVHASIAPWDEKTTELLTECERMREALERDRKSSSEEEVAARLVAIVDYLEEAPESRSDPRAHDFLLDLAEREIYTGPPEVVEGILRKCLETHDRLLPYDSYDRLIVEDEIALCLDRQGKNDEARQVWDRILPIVDERHPLNEAVVIFRVHLAQHWMRQRDQKKATALLEEAVGKLRRVEQLSPAGLFIPYRQLLQNLAGAGKWKELLDYSGQAIRNFTPYCSPDDTHLLVAKAHRANALRRLGRWPEFREIAEELWRLRTDAAIEDPATYEVFMGLGTDLQDRGELPTARIVLEQTLAAMTRLFGADHPSTLIVQGNLANTLEDLGEYQESMALEEDLLHYWSRTLPEDADDLQKARLNLAHTYSCLHRHTEALALRQAAVAVWTAAEQTPGRQVLLQRARLALGTSLMNVGRTSEAREITEEATVALAGLRSPDNYDVLFGWQTVVKLRRLSGDFEGADETEKRYLHAWESSANPPPGLEEARFDRLWTLALLQRDEELIEPLARARKSVRAMIDRAVQLSSEREIDLRSSLLFAHISTLLSLSGPDDALEDFALCESLRGIRMVTAHARRAVADDDEVRAAREHIAALGRDLKQATAGEPKDDDAWMKTFRERDEEERRLGRYLASLPGSLPPRIDLDRILDAFEPNAAAIAWWIYDHREAYPEEAPYLRTSKRVTAFIVRPKRKIIRLDLGELESIERACRRWAGEIAGDEARPNTEAARAVATLLLEPLLRYLEGVEELTILPDGVLHAVPFDALPLNGKRELLGDRFRTNRRVTLRELELDAVPIPPQPRLLAVGGIDYDHPPTEIAAVEAGAEPEAASPDVDLAGVAQVIARGGKGDKFEHLSSSADEVTSLAKCFVDGPGSRENTDVLRGRQASGEALWQLAPGANYLHIATHGFFDNEWIERDSGGEALDAVIGIGSKNPLSDYVMRMSPMLLCGLAMAGANLEADSLGRLAGAVTAEELSRLDLSECRLAVLSGCETNVGFRFSGRGVASLQHALQLAGARSVVASLWPVDDLITQEFMKEFYDRLWNQGKGPAQALREVRDSLRRRHLPLRQWAAWVLSGDPD